MAIESQAANFSKTTVAGSPVYKTQASTDLSLSSNTLVTGNVQTATTRLAGKETVAAINVSSAFSTNGTAATASTATLTLLDNHYSLAGTTGTTPALTIETPTATRTFFQDKSGTAGTATFEFNKAPTVGQSLAVTMVKPDGTTVTKAFRVAAVGVVPGTLSGGFVEFPTYNSGSVGDSAQATDAANNFKAAFESDNGFGDSTNGAIGRCYANLTDTGEVPSGVDAGKVIMQATRPGTVTNTTITPTATAATATIMVDSGSFGTSTIVFTNADSTTWTITAAALGGGNPSTKTQVNTDLISHADGGTVQLKASIDAAIAAGDLDFTASAISNNNEGNPRVITLTSTTADVRSNQTIGGTLVSGNVILVNQTTAGGSQGTLATTGGVAFVDGTSYTMASAFTGGVDDTASLAQAEVNIAHSGRWAAYKLKEAVSDTTNGLGNYGLTATNVNNVVTFTADTGAAGNSTKFTTNTGWSQVSTVLPPTHPTGGTDAVLPDFAYRLSLDGVNYTDWTTIISDVKAADVGLKLGTMNIPNNVPYIQFGFNTKGGDLTSKTGKISFEFVGGS